MRIISAHVREGAIVLDEQTDLPEGAAVTVLADTTEREFDVPQEPKRTSLQRWKMPIVET
jgi:hypothetical protein